MKLSRNNKLFLFIGVLLIIICIYYYFSNNEHEQFQTTTKKPTKSEKVPDIKITDEMKEYTIRKQINDNRNKDNIMKSIIRAKHTIKENGVDEPNRTILWDIQKDKTMFEIYANGELISNINSKGNDNIIIGYKRNVGNRSFDLYYSINGYEATETVSSSPLLVNPDATVTHTIEFLALERFDHTPNLKATLDRWIKSKINEDTITLNEIIKEYGDISIWDVSGITDMSSLFANTNLKDLTFIEDYNISEWDTSNVTDMSQMFYQSNFNGDITNWATHNVKNMSQMFYGNTKFTGQIKSWKTSEVTDMSEMFKNSDFNQAIGGWDTGNVTNMSGMFYNNTSFNKDISNWNLENVTNMNDMFTKATAFYNDSPATTTLGKHSYEHRDSFCANIEKYQEKFEDQVKICYNDGTKICGYSVDTNTPSNECDGCQTPAQIVSYKSSTQQLAWKCKPINYSTPKLNISHTKKCFNEGFCNTHCVSKKGIQKADGWTCLKPLDVNASCTDGDDCKNRCKTGKGTHHGTNGWKCTPTTCGACVGYEQPFKGIWSHNNEECIIYTQKSGHLETINSGRQNIRTMPNRANYVASGWDGLSDGHGKSNPDGYALNCSIPEKDRAEQAQVQRLAAEAKEADDKRVAAEAKEAEDQRVAADAKEAEDQRVADAETKSKADAAALEAKYGSLRMQGAAARPGSAAPAADTIASGEPCGPRLSRWGGGGAGDWGAGVLKPDECNKCQNGGSASSRYDRGYDQFYCD